MGVGQCHLFGPCKGRDTPTVVETQTSHVSAVIRKFSIRKHLDDMMTLEPQSTILCVCPAHVYVSRPVGGTRLVSIIQKGKPEAEAIVIVQNLCSPFLRNYQPQRRVPARSSVMYNLS